jgi:N-acetylglucosaminyldiphosphoundecaprenol N-acetyl-beta-D-mannosaminyltransferase
MTSNQLLEITVPTQSRSIILEEIKKYIRQSTDFCHVVSLNPENLIIAQKDRLFKKVIQTAQIKIIDGIGIVLAARMLGIPIGERISGVEVMKNLITCAGKGSLTVLLVGGRGDLALKLSKCYQEKFPEAKFIGSEGFKNIRKPTKREEEKILSIVRSIKPNLIFAAYGSPWQELWIERHKRKFKGIVVMGVGQGFDVEGGVARRAPVWVQRLGFEWLFRLVTQPWRWRRQLKLIEFMWLVMKQKFSSNHE